VPLEVRAAEALSALSVEGDGCPRFGTGPQDPPHEVPRMAGTGTDEVRDRLRRARRGSVQGVPVTDLPRRRIARVNAAAPEAMAVIIPLAETALPQWKRVGVGDELVLYEGARACGIGFVVWVAATLSPVPEDDVDCFCAWARAGLW
jgi:hypothetical protein